MVDCITLPYNCLSFLEDHWPCSLRVGGVYFFDLLMSGLDHVTCFGQWHMSKGDVHNIQAEDLGITVWFCHKILCS